MPKLCPFKALLLAVGVQLAATSLASADKIISQSTQKYPDKDFGQLIVQNIILHIEVIEVEAMGNTKRTHFSVTCQVQDTKAVPEDLMQFDLVFDLRDKDEKPVELISAYGQWIRGKQFSGCGTDNGDRVDGPAPVTHMDVQLTAYRTVHFNPSRLDPSP